MTRPVQAAIATRTQSSEVRMCRPHSTATDLFRTWMTSDPSAPAKRIDDIAHLHAGLDEGLPSIVLDLPELEIGPGYEAWAGTYDVLPNPLINLEEPLVRALVDSSPPG